MIKLIISLTFFLSFNIHSHTVYDFWGNESHHTHESNGVRDGLKGMMHALRGPERRAQAEKQRQHEIKLKQMEIDAANARYRAEEERSKAARTYTDYNYNSQLEQLKEENRRIRASKEASRKEAYEAMKKRRTIQEKNKEKEKMGATWIKDSHVVSEDLKSYAVITVDGTGKLMVTLSFNSLSCTAKESRAVSASPVYVNGNLVEINTRCDSANSMHYWAANEKGQDYIVQQFKKSRTVKVENQNRTYETSYTANGFTKAWNAAKNNSETLN